MTIALDQIRKDFRPHRSGAARGDKMDLRCPKCNSTDLKKVSLAYQEGLFRADARTRLRAVVVGSSGPDLVVGRATTQGSQQSALSTLLSPPKKWSYVKLVVGFAALSFVALVIYIHGVMASSSISSSLPVKLYALIASCVFGFLGLLTWRHNHSVYARQMEEWERSFLCARCGTVTQEKPNEI